jgi:hypothetical protein
MNTSCSFYAIRQSAKKEACGAVHQPNSSIDHEVITHSLKLQDFRYTAGYSELYIEISAQ